MKSPLASACEGAYVGSPSSYVGSLLERYRVVFLQLPLEVVPEGVRVAFTTVDPDHDPEASAVEVLQVRNERPTVLPGRMLRPRQVDKVLKFRPGRPPTRPPPVHPEEEAPVLTVV